MSWRANLGRACAVTCAAGLACNDLLGIESLPPHTEPQVEYASVACRTCVESQCDAEEKRCADSPACAAGFRCLAACKSEDWACRAACRDAVPAAPPAGYADLDACRRQACVAECYANGAGVGLGDGDCGPCVEDLCGTELLACVQKEACEALVYCSVGKQPIDPDRVSSCLSNYPEGRDDALAFHACIAGGTSCSACNFGRDFACSGEYAWSAARDMSTVYHLGLGQYWGLGPAPAGFDVTSCLAPFCGADVDGRCTKPESTSQSLEGGVDVGMPTPFNGCLQVEKPGWVPTIVYFGRPIVRSEGWMTLAMLTPEQHDTILRPVGVTPDPARGQLWVVSQDCAIDPARGVRFAPISGVEPVYTQFGALFPSATSTTGDAVTVFVNVPPGLWTVAATDADSGEPIASYQVRVAAGWLTAMWLLPAPLGQ